MKLALCTICLNEEEFLEANYQQHKDWPGLVAWYFVHGACKQYADANPHMVSGDGLSVDGTTAVLRKLSEADERVRWANVPGPVSHENPAMEKAALRNVYLQQMRNALPQFAIDWFAIIDADEFYAHEHQQRLSELMAKAPSAIESIRTTYHDLWRPPSIAHLPRWMYEVSGGYWSVPHTRFFRWHQNLEYGANHNLPSLPEPAGRLWGGSACHVLGIDGPQKIHLGFTRGAATREATNRFYVKRGEGPQDGRQWYVDCRSAWETWQPGDVLPHGATVTAVADPLIVETVKGLKLPETSDANAGSH